MVEKFKYNCCHPVKLTDNKTGLVLNRPCGKCLNCRNQVSARYVNLINVELQKYKYNYFLTLTYNDDYLPTGELTCNIEKYRKNENYLEIIPNFKSYTSVGELIESYGIVENFNAENYEEYIKKVNHRINYDGKILLLNRHQVQKFIKRLNISFKRFASTDKSLRYFALLEYGAKFYRPHVHILLHTNDSRIEEYFATKLRCIDTRRQKYLSKIWKFGHLVLKRATSTGVASYISRYVSTINCDIPVLCTRRSCPKIIHSSHYGDFFYSSNLVDFDSLADMSVEDYSKKVISTPYGFLKPSQSDYVNSFVCPKLPYSNFLNTTDIHTLLNLREPFFERRSEQAKGLAALMLSKIPLGYTFSYLRQIMQHSFLLHLSLDDNYRYKKAQFFYNILYRILSVSERWLMFHNGTWSDVNKYLDYFQFNEMRQLNDFYRLQEIYYQDHEFNENDLQFLYNNADHNPNETTFQKQINYVNKLKCEKHRNKKLHNNLNFEV